MKTIEMTESDYMSYRNGYDGYCTDCNAVSRYGCTEPDAENYECDECGENTAIGIDNALIIGHIEIKD